MKFQIHRFEETDSTSAALKRSCSELPPGTVFVAGMQRNAYGRNGRSFFCSPGSGLYFSILLPASLPLELTAAAAVMLRRAIRRVSGVQTDIKWLNDLCIQGRKAAGILCEVCHDAQNRPRMVLGIGVNVHDPGFEGALRSTACWLDEFAPGPVSREALLQAFLEELGIYLAGPQSCDWIDEYRHALLWKNRKVKLVQGHTVKDCVLVDADSHGNLIVSRNRNLEVVSSGEIHLLLAE